MFFFCVCSSLVCALGMGNWLGLYTGTKNIYGGMEDTKLQTPILY